MSPSSTISSKGQVTVPIEVRRRLGVKAGDQLEFAFEGGRTILRRVRPQINPFERYIGALPAFSSREEMDAWIRGLRDPEDGSEKQP